MIGAIDKRAEYFANILQTFYKMFIWLKTSGKDNKSFIFRELLSIQHILHIPPLRAQPLCLLVPTILYSFPSGSRAAFLTRLPVTTGTSGSTAFLFLPFDVAAGLAGFNLVCSFLDMVLTDARGLETSAPSKE